MKKKTTTFGISSERLARLLGIGLALDEQEQGTHEQPKAELLRARLAGTLPLAPDVVDALPAIFGRLSKELIPLSGKTLDEVLRDPDVSLDVIQTVKDYAKDLASRAGSEADHAASIAIYYAAIASAVLFHGKKITRHSFESLAESFETLGHKSWIPSDILRHFSKARKLCEKMS